MRTLTKSLVAASAAAALSATYVGIASADTIAVDGDTAKAVNNFVVTSCTNGVTSAAATSSGSVTVTSTGTQNGSHFAQTTTATAHSSVSSPVTVSADGTATVPNGFNGNANPPKTFSIPISATVPAGTAPMTRTVTVTVSGAEWKNSSGVTGSTVSLQATYDVVVSCSDSTAPVLNLPSNQVVEATSASGAVVTYTATANDAVDGAVTPSCSPVSGATFALGTTTVDCSATDTAGNTSSGSFTVTVRDTTAPVVTPPANVTAEATSASGAAVTYGAASASDLVDGSVPASCTPASGSTFALGNTTVTCTATDAHSNTGSATFTVSVGDTTPPVVTVPGDQTLEATGPSGAAYAYSPAPSATDAVAGSPAVTCVPPSGSTFSIGTTTVTCSASDGTQTGSNHFDVTVQDTTGPVLSDIPATNATLEATNALGAPLAAFAPTAEDLVDGARPVVCTNDDDSSVITAATIYPIDVTTNVTCSSSDATGNPSTATYAITVVDTTGPALADLDDVGPIEATSAAGAPASFTVSAIDIVDGSVPAVCTPASGSTFALGYTTVTCTATDAHNNDSDTKSFTVNVVDTTAPVIASHGNETAEATGPTGAAVSYTAPTWTDAVDGSGSATCLPASGSTFALGATTVTCTKTDAHSNTATPSTFTVTVQDTTAPVIADHADVTATATSNGTAVVTYTSPSWTDAVDGSGTASCTPASGSTFSIGTTQVTCTVTDAHNNTATSHFNVIVSYAWTGFYQPIDAAPNNSSGKDSAFINGSVYNKAKAGSTIPVKFSLGGNQGLSIFANGSPSAAPVACNGTGVYDAIEETGTATVSSLKYDATANQYIYSWKTDTKWAGTCQRLTVKLADGSSHYAFFNFTK